MKTNDKRTAFILAAGLGTRLKELTSDRPKALVELNQKPLLEIVIDNLISQNFNHFVINIHHYGDKILDYFKNKNYDNVTIEISDERDLLLDTGGAILKALPYFKNSKAVLIHNVDIITDEANKTVTLMNDTIGVKVLEITPTLVANFKKLGVDLSSSLYSGADAQMYNDRASWYSWSLRPLGYFEEQNKIESPSKAFYEAGEYVSEGLLKGAEGKLSADKAKWFSWATKPLEWFKEKNDINSPSREFDAMGGFIAQGLFNGVDSGLSETAFAKIFDRLRYAMLQVKTRVHETTLEIRSYFEEMVTSVVDSITIMIDSFSGMSAFGITTPTYPNAVIPQVNLKAEGCTVDGCRMVIGGDTGVEIVSGICRKAVVENYDLIVKGVEQGVAEGNSESNALLREQNDLLRAMLQKENTVSLDGRTIAKSVEAYQRTRGTTIVVGGAY